MKISVILPTRNEEALIRGTLMDISRYLNSKKYRYEILVVLNGCTDNTEKIVRKLTLKNRSIKILKSKPGYGTALKKGMQVAKGDYIAVFNVDFYDLDLIKLIDVNMCGKDMIIGSKMSFWSVDNRSMVRKMISKIYNLYLKLFVGFNGSDTHGIKLVKSYPLKTVLKKCRTSSGIMDTEFVIRFQRLGFKIMDFPVVVEEKRLPRFTGRLLQTPIDIIELHKALK